GLCQPAGLYAVKAPVFSMAKLRAVDAILGPEMKSTGEAMGVARDLATAQYRAFLSTMDDLPADGAALCSIADGDKLEALPIRRASVERRIPCLTSLDTAGALVEALKGARRRSAWSVIALDEFATIQSGEPVRP